MSRVKELADRLADVPLFGRCDKHDLRRVARHAETMTLEAGREVVRQGEDGDAMFVILDGAALVARDGVEVARLGAGSYFGELALLDPAPHSATVRLTDDTELAVFDVRMMRVLLREIPMITAEMMAHLATRVRDAGTPPASRSSASKPPDRLAGPPRTRSPAEANSPRRRARFVSLDDRVNAERHPIQLRGRKIGAPSANRAESGSSGSISRSSYPVSM